MMSKTLRWLLAGTVLTVAALALGRAVLRRSNTQVHRIGQ
jgi:hypothetical protein